MICKQCGMFYFKEQKHKCKEEIFVCSNTKNITQEDNKLIDEFIDRARARNMEEVKI